MLVDIITQHDLADFKKEIRLLFQQSPAQKNWLKSSELKKLLGISSGTLLKLRKSGTLPYTKFGKSYFYKLTEVEKALQLCQQNSPL